MLSSSIILNYPNIEIEKLTPKAAVLWLDLNLAIYVWQAFQRCRAEAW